MLDPRLYRAAFVLVLLAVLVAAFSIENRPRPIGTTLATDAWNAEGAARELDALAREFPDRKAGSPADEQLAQRVAAALRADGFTTRLDRFTGTTGDGERQLVNVVATRPGAPGPGLVVVAHRDALGHGAKAELSGTAALLELARVIGVARLRRTVTFVSTSGGSSGNAGARRLAQTLGERADAILVLGDLGGSVVRRPLVVGFSDGRGQASLQLRRTLDAAVRAEARTDTGTPRTLTQWARMAQPLTVGEQGPVVRGGQPAVLLSVSGERGPPADARVVPERFEAFGRSALRALYALDNGPDLAQPPTGDLLARGKVVPSWAVRLLVLALLVPPLLAAIDGFARARRRQEPVEPWLRWTLATALPFLVACVFARLLALVGLLGGAPPNPLPAAALDVDGGAIAAMVAVALAFVLGWLARPWLLRRLQVTDRPSATGAPIAVLLTATVTAVVLWVLNPYAALLLVPAVHLWMFALAGRDGAGIVSRPAGLVLVALGLLAPLAVAVADARSLGMGPGQSVWFWLLLLAGGQIPIWSWVVWSAAAGCAVAAALVVVRRVRPAPTEGVPRVTGPRRHAGPGSLGGTPSALRGGWTDGR